MPRRRSARERVRRTRPRESRPRDPRAAPRALKHHRDACERQKFDGTHLEPHRRRIQFNAAGLNLATLPPLAHALALSRVEKLPPVRAQVVAVRLQRHPAAGAHVVDRVVLHLRLDCRMPRLLAPPAAALVVGNVIVIVREQPVSNQPQLLPVAEREAFAARRAQDAGNAERAVSNLEDGAAGRAAGGVCMCEPGDRLGGGVEACSSALAVVLGRIDSAAWRASANLSVLLRVHVGLRPAARASGPAGPDTRARLCFSRAAAGSA